MANKLQKHQVLPKVALSSPSPNTQTCDNCHSSLHPTITPSTNLNSNDSTKVSWYSLLGRSKTWNWALGIAALGTGLIYFMLGWLYLDWTARKDFIEYCQSLQDTNRNLTVSCYAALNAKLGPPPLTKIFRRLIGSDYRALLDGNDVLPSRELRGLPVYSRSLRVLSVDLYLLIAILVGLLIIFLRLALPTLRIHHSERILGDYGNDYGHIRPDLDVVKKSISLQDRSGEDVRSDGCEIAILREDVPEHSGDGSLLPRSETEEDGPGSIPIIEATPGLRQRNVPWTTEEEQLLKSQRDAGFSWADIAKASHVLEGQDTKNINLFPTRTKGSIKKHWYKDMHYAESDKDRDAALLTAIKEYEDAARLKAIKE